MISRHTHPRRSVFRIVSLSFFVFLLAAGPALAGVDELRVTEVAPIGDLVEVTHFSTNAFVTSTSLPFCHRFSYASSIPSGTSFAAGESKTFTVSGLNDTDSDIWLYRAAPFGNAANIISGMKYGPAPNVGRAGLAAGVGLWPSASAFVPAPAAGQTLQLQTEDPTDPANWGSAPASSNAYFGTGTEIANPLPNIPKSPITVGLLPIADSLTSPLGLRQPDDGTGRIFIYDQVGKVFVWLDGALSPAPFLSVTNRLVILNAGFEERGLLGLALHPDFVSNGLIYTYTSEPTGPAADFTISMAGSPNHHAVIAEWQVSGGNPDAIDPASRRELLRIEEPQSNHNGGEIEFGPDGNLYIALGDGGSSNDAADGHGTRGNGQDPTTVLGSILRIDPGGTNSANGAYGIPAGNPFVGHPSFAEEIFAYGFRNPYRFSFDPDTGDLLVGDVGQGDIEELSVVRAGDNQGWRLKEGSFFFDPVSTFVTTIPFEPFPPDLVDPIAEYDHGDGISIMGGFTYEGHRIGDLADHYVFGDFGTPGGRLFALTPDTNIVELTIGADDRSLDFRLKGLGRDLEGEIYLLGSTTVGPSGASGKVFKLIPLIGIEDLVVNPTTTRVDFVCDSSVSNHTIQANVHLPNAGGWSNRTATLTTLSNQLLRAEFATSSELVESYRVAP